MNTNVDRRSTGRYGGTVAIDSLFFVFFFFGVPTPFFKQYKNRSKKASLYILSTLDQFPIHFIASISFLVSNVYLLRLSTCLFIGIYIGYLKFMCFFLCSFNEFGFEKTVRTASTLN